MDQSFVSVPLQLPYSTYGTLSEKTTDIWVVCHGYGQLAKHFIKRFDVISPETHFVIAPQGPSIFYMNQYSKVGASWLTREYREEGVSNYLLYIDTIWAQYEEFIKGRDINIHALGFSQGVATICRWVVHKQLPIKKLVMWAARYPNEWTSEDIAFLKASTEFLLVVGDQDEFVTEKVLDEEYKRFQEKLGISPKLIRFEGGHVVTREVLQSIGG